MDLIRRVRGGKAHGLVLPLLMTAAGTKFGKTEAGSVWLDPTLTTPYEFYQFWLNRRRSRRGEISEVLHVSRSRRESQSSSAPDAREPEKRHAQRELAREVTRLVHGEAAVREAEAAREKLFGGDVADDVGERTAAVFPNVPSTSTRRTSLTDGRSSSSCSRRGSGTAQKARPRG